MIKKILPSILLFAALTYLLPFVCLLLPAGASGSAGFAPAASAPPDTGGGAAGLWNGLGQPDEPSPAAPESGNGSDGAAAPEAAGLAQLEIQLWDEGAGRLLSLPVEEYLIGVMAAEMPPSWPDEALMAQAVAAHSYVLSQREQAGAALEGGWLAVDPARRQGFLTDEVLRSYWGDAYEENHARLAALAAQVKDELVLYDGAPAAACYHAISCGATEASQNVWAEALPYLQGVDSPLDLTSPDYEKAVTYTPQQMYDALSLGCPGLDLSGAPNSWFGEVRYTGAGYVAEQQVGGAAVSGLALRAALGLRSACFTVDYADGVFTVTTRGYGHGVGMSQYGANALALTGKTHAEILSFYYPGTTLGTA